ncbi:MAG: pyridoxamine 5'-phosphate oxidase family protein [Planctomycetes bacterium]|nr:pyridoxamine 5'-phosphate oxidase family protein [Planctomycetota bacterium]
MRRYISDIAFTPSVKDVQLEKGSRSTYERVESGMGWQQNVTPELEFFLSGLDMFYFATATADGQPYVQYRGGPRGFLKVVDERTLAFADFAGNRQYLSLGNLRENDKVLLFLIDYAQRQRIKIWGTARVIENDPDLLANLSDASYAGRPERAIVVTVEAWDVNCPQHIHRRLPAESAEATIAALRRRIAELEAELARTE